MDHRRTSTTGTGPGSGHSVTTPPGDDRPGEHTAPWNLRVGHSGQVLGVDAAPRLSWRLPDGAGRQLAYEVRTGDGATSGRVDSPRCQLVEVPAALTSRQRMAFLVKVWTDLGESSWSKPIEVEAGLLRPEDWTASWLQVPEDEPPAKGARPGYWVRREVELKGPIARARLYISAHGLYEAHINGVRVGDLELTPGYTQYRHRIQYHTFDVTGLVAEGLNALAVLLTDGWYRGQVGMPRAADQYGDHVGLLAQLEVAYADGSGAVAGTDATWRCGPSHILAADLIGGQAEDRSLVDPAILQPRYDDDSWRPAQGCGDPARLVVSAAPPVRRIEEIRPVAVTRPRPGIQVVDLSQNINGWIRLADLGPAGTEVTLTHGEWLDDRGDVTTDHLAPDFPILPGRLEAGQVDRVVSAGREGDIFEPRFTTHGFQYVRVEGHPGELTPDDVTGVVVHTDLTRTGWFACSDERISRLHEAAVWSFRGNACDIPTDCPQRERAGWTGDWQLYVPTAAFLYDVDGFTRKWLGDVVLDQRDDGLVANISPATPFEGFNGPLGRLHGSAGWGDVIVVAPWELYQAYGDDVVLGECWDAMERWMTFAATSAATGRHPDREAARPRPLPYERYLWDTGFHWGEWLEPDADLGDFAAFAAGDKSEVATAYLHRSARLMVEIARVLGKPVDTAASYQQLADGALGAWRSEFIHSDGSLLVDTQASHVRALAFGLVPDELRDRTARRLVDLIRAAGTRVGTGFLSTPYLLPVLADTRHLDVAYELLLQDEPPSWMAMIKRGATTVWERWEGVDDDGVPHESLNHYSKGAVISFLHRHTAGLRPTAAGYRSFTVAPQPGGGLTWARARLECPYGPIAVDWEVEGDGLRLSVQVPAGTVGTVVLPDGSQYEASNGRHTWRSHTAAPMT